jgi:hypothetical protein
MVSLCQKSSDGGPVGYEKCIFQLGLKSST